MQVEIVGGPGDGTILEDRIAFVGRKRVDIPCASGGCRMLEYIGDEDGVAYWLDIGFKKPPPCMCSECRAARAALDG